jgi:hypothetical protein
MAPWPSGCARRPCQVCGSPRSELVYVLAPVPSKRSLVEMYGGAPCSVACARLTAAVCPRYTAESPTGIYVVPRHDRVDLIGNDLNNDDEYDLAGLSPLCIVHVHAHRSLERQAAVCVDKALSGP